jgi:hypothetical protein
MIKTDRLMLLIPRMKCINTLCGPNVNNFFNIKAGGTYGNHRALKGKSFYRVLSDGCNVLLYSYDR